MRWLVLTANWFAKVYTGTPAAMRWVFWVIPIVYLISPLDMDHLFPIGRIDDLLLVVFVIWAIERTAHYREFFEEARTRHERAGKRGEQGAEAVVSPPRAPHEVLGVAPNANRIEIKKAYRKLVGMYHPDKFAHLGPEFEETARHRTREIIEAYERMTA